MPIYEYWCENCHHELEVIQKISDEPLKDCPACGESKLRKKISPVGFRLKGSGWYETDFKGKEKQKNIAKGDDSTPSESKLGDKLPAEKASSDKKASGKGTDKSGSQSSKTQAHTG